MPTTMQIAGALIQSFEGLRLTAYKDSGGVLTISYGHTGPDVTLGMKCTAEQAQAWFEKDCAGLLKMVSDRTPLEAACLVSFGYNCGAGALKKLLSGEIQMGDRIRDRVGNILPGLVSRRKLEGTLVAVARDLAAVQS